MAADPISIKDTGDRVKRLGDHVMLVAGIDASGHPEFIKNAPAVNTSTTALEPAQGSLTIAAAGTPQALAATRLVESVEVFALPDNTGNILAGFSEVGGGNLRIIPAGDAWTLSAVSGKKIDLASIYVDAEDSGDGVVWSAIN